MRRYHDEEWSVPVHDDRRHFELIILEGAQAGLTWESVLRRREAYRAAFPGFDFRRVASFGEADKARLLGDAGIIRNRAKVESAVANARAFLALQAGSGSFDAYVRASWAAGRDGTASGTSRSYRRRPRSRRR
jgi:DNA-3-methyladenine glycosylase I